MGTRKGLFINIGNKKGGIGKTTATMIVASLIHAKTDKTVCVVDIDPQRSFFDKRQREIKMIERDDPSLVNALIKLKKEGRGVYDVRELDLFPRGAQDTVLEQEKVFNKLKAFKQEALDKWDYVFFDFPGFTDSKEFTRMLFLMDYILIPFYVDDNSAPSTVKYINNLQEIVETGAASLKDIAVFMFRYSDAKNVALFNEYETKISGLGVKVMQNKIWDAVEIERSRSTVIPFDLPGKRSLVPFIQEIMAFCER
jgi:chromosome partitioning protein